MNFEKLNMDIETAEGYLFYKAVEKTGLENISPVGEENDIDKGFLFDPPTRILQFCYENGTGSSQCVAVILELEQ